MISSLHEHISTLTVCVSDSLMLCFSGSLVLSSNKLYSWNDALFEGLSALRYFYIDSNDFTFLNGSLLEGRSALISNIHLSNNPWNCSCDLLALVEWVKENKAKVARANETYCQYPMAVSGKLMANMSLKQCTEQPVYHRVYVNIIISIVCIVLILLVISAVCLRFRVEIEVMLFIKFNIRLRETIKALHTDESLMTYDAFISFNQADYLFVKNSIMPRLERECDPKFRLCVHFRDFELGVPIADNISNAIDCSSRTIMLVSRSFLSSSWCHYEFQQVHYKVMTEGKGRLIIILMEDIQPHEVRDKQLRTYISTYTYLHCNDRLFWERLLFNMPRTPVSQLQTQSRSLLNYTDTAQE